MSIMDFMAYSPLREPHMTRQLLIQKKKQDARLLKDGWSAEEITWLAREDLQDWQIDQLVFKARHLYDHDVPSLESQRIAQMDLEHIWRRPTPANNARLNHLHRDLLNPTPPPTLGSHFQLPESAPSSVHPGNAPRHVSTPPGFPAGMSQTRRLPQVPTQARAPHPLAQSSRASNVYNYSAEYADHELPPHYAPMINHQSLHDDNSFAFNPYVQPTTIPAPSPKPPTLEASLARWYAEQVVSALVLPGGFRQGTNGSDDKLWDDEAVIWASFARAAPHYRKAAISPYSRVVSPIIPRDTSTEVEDPFGIAWKHQAQVSPHLVNFISNMIERMRIEPSAIIAAVWYLQGMGLHVGDEGKGRALRKLLSSSATLHDEAIERRVATLGFLLAGKWLDDASFETKHWAEVSDVPVEQIIALEYAILADTHYSLYISPSAWIDHLQQQWIELESRGLGQKPMGILVLDCLMDLGEKANPKPKSVRIPPWQLDTWYCDNIDARLEAAFYAEPEEEMFEDSYFMPFSGSGPVSNPLSGWSTPNPNIEMVDAARFVYALVDEVLESSEMKEAEATPGLDVHEDMENIGTESEDEDDDEILEYDGAKRFLPTMSEMRRSLSNSSTQSDLIIEWRDNVQAAVENRFDHIHYSPSTPAYQPNPINTIHIPIPFH